MLDDIFSYSESSLKDANKILDKYQEVYEQAKAAEIAGDKNQYKGTNGISQTAAKWLNDYSKAVENYNDALASGDTSKIAEAKAEFDAVDESVQSLLQSDMSGYADSFNEISDQLDTAAVSAQNFKDAINGVDTSNASKKVKETADTMNKSGESKTVTVSAYMETGVSPSSISANNSITLPAVTWLFDVAYNSNGGSGSMSTDTVSYGSNYRRCCCEYNNWCICKL